MNRIILTGNPNTGKTTFFNTMTNSNEHTGNWHGVTVDIKKSKYKFNKKEYEICDLPGIYSLDTYSMEEKVATDFIYQNLDSIFLCIVDANNLRRNLYLCLELKKVTDNIILVVNMAKEVKMDYKLLEKELGVKVVLIDARKKKSALKVKKQIEDLCNIKTLKSLKMPFKEINDFKLDKFQEKTVKAFKRIDLVLKKCNYNFNKVYGYSKIDKIVLSQRFSFILFALILGLIFFLTFGRVGSFLSEGFGRIIEVINNYIINFLEKVIKNEVVIKFIKEAVLGGALAVLTFVPQIVIMLVSMSILEEVGYLSRVALMFDSPLKKLGLNGRSAFSLLMGFGCTTTAVITTRNLDNKKLQQRTALLLPFMSCSAKLPVFAVICSAFLKKYKTIVVCMLYLVSILTMFIVSLFLNKLSKPTKNNTFMLELPKYRAPSFTKVIKSVCKNVVDFITRVGSVLLISSIIVFILYNFNFKFEYVGERGNNILKSLASFVSVIFIPLGFDKYLSIALITGIIAKEMVVSSLAIINGVDSQNLASSLLVASSVVHLNMTQALTFMVFILLYPPCLSALISTKKEVGTKVMLKSFVLQLIVAYVVALLTRFVVNLIVIGYWFISLGVVIFVAILILLMLKYIKPRYEFSAVVNNCSNCNSCKEKKYGNAKLQRWGY